MSLFSSVPELVALAPKALQSVDAVVVSAQDAVSRDLYALCRARSATLLGADDGRRSGEADERLAVLSSWPTSELFTEADRACLTMTEQFALDVTAVDDVQRSDLVEALGDDAPTLVRVLYAVDAELRLRGAFTQLFGVDPIGTTVPDSSAGLATALNEMTWAVARLGALDPLTTELVRLRGARIHNCRLCKALRHAGAAKAGGDEKVFDKIDEYEKSDLTERQKVSLRLTDAMLSRPTAYPAALVEEVHEHYPPVEAVEIVLDVVRNARNKVAVANGTDGEGVGAGLTFYDTDADGRFELVDGSAAGVRAAFQPR